MKFLGHKSLIALTLFAGLSSATAALAGTITWTNWTPPGTAGNPGSATGNMGGTVVTYSGQLVTVDSNYPSWMPASSYTGGNVSNAPPANFNAIHMTGGSSTLVETITFSKPVTNPVFAIWSLGQGGDPTTFNFTSPFTIQAGGPSVEYNGQSITASGNTVTGVEGNGVIQFAGTYSSLSFTTPLFENYYDFTVGAPVVPEPSSLALLGTGLLGVVGTIRKRIRNS